jgi:hypothetical protein
MRLLEKILTIELPTQIVIVSSVHFYVAVFFTFCFVLMVQVGTVFTRIYIVAHT